MQLKKYKFKYLLSTALLSFHFVLGYSQKNYPEETPKQELRYENKEYISSIKSVQLYPLEKEAQLPIIQLNTDDQLILSFDDLRADHRDVYMSLEYCDADWQPSRVSQLDYAEGYNEDRVVEINASISTVYPYTHYEASFPNEYLKPKIAGNYLLKVYEDADEEKLLLTRKFYVLKDIMNVQASVEPSPNVSNRASHQKVNLRLSMASITVQNPHRDLSVQVMQNKREDLTISVDEPSKIDPSELVYKLPNTLDFKGNNEFLFADLRSFKMGSEDIKSISRDTGIHINLQEDEVRIGQKYASTYDENGNFYIRNMDYNDDNLEGDYAEVTFSLKAPPLAEGTIHVIGAFNNFSADSDSQLEYKEDEGFWKTDLFLKQGLYDYDYVLKKPDGQVETDAFSGSYFETGNTYQVLIYYKRPGTYWDELIGYQEVGINNKNN